MSLKIYGVPASRAFRTYWMAQELGLEFESVPVSFSTGELRSEAYLKINPNARIPAIEDDGFALWESMAINLYLARKHGGPLQPKTLQDEARAMQWSFWVMTEVEKPALTALMHRVLRPEDQRDPAAAEAAIEELKPPFAVLDDALAMSDYLLGTDFTVADLNVAAVMSWARLAKIDFAAWPSLEDWLKRCLKRPAAKVEL